MNDLELVDRKTTGYTVSTEESLKVTGALTRLN